MHTCNVPGLLLYLSFNLMEKCKTGAIKQGISLTCSGKLNQEHYLL